MLRSWCAGDRSQENQLFSTIYPVLRSMARNQWRGHRDGMTLQATDLAHDAYLRLFEDSAIDWKTRAQFFAVASTVMRRVIIDYIRERSAIKRGGEVKKISLSSLTDPDFQLLQTEENWLGLDRVLEIFEQIDPQGSRIVEMRYFIGMTVSEISQALDCSITSVERQWRAARSWLQLQMEDCELSSALKK